METLLAILSIIEFGSKTYREAKEAFARDHEMTPEEEQQLKAREDAIFGGAAADPEANI